MEPFGPRRVFSSAFLLIGRKQKSPLHVGNALSTDNLLNGFSVFYKIGIHLSSTSVTLSCASWLLSLKESAENDSFCAGSGGGCPWLQVKGLDSDIVQEEGPKPMTSSRPLCWDVVFFSRAVSGSKSLSL